MFDGDIHDDPQRRADGSNPASELKALFARMDPLLDESGLDGSSALDKAGEAELRAMAAIFDLNPEGPPAEVWKRVRSVLARQGAGQPDAAGDTEAAHPLTLMVVEDDAEMAADLVDVLTDAGHGVVGPFHSAEAAMAAAALHSIDMALLDINLSGESSGLDLARALKSAWGIPAIFLSGDVTAAAQNAELVSALVLKPYRARDVLAAVRAAAKPSAPTAL